MSFSKWIAIGAFVAAAGVMIGAFGAHGLEDRLDEQQRATYEIGVRYQMYTAFGIVAVGLLVSIGGEQRGLTASAWCLVFGVCVFSGCLYGLALGGPRFLGAIVPIGGLAAIAGWVLLGAAAWGGRNVRSQT